MNTPSRTRSLDRFTQTRRTFRWDMTQDVSATELADMRLWLDSRSEGGRLDPEVPDASTWSAGLARAIIESLLGMRDRRQLERWMMPSLYAALKHLHLGSASTGRSRRSCFPSAWRSDDVAPGVAEAAVVVRGPQHSYAVALRLEAFRGRWITTALEIA